MAIYFPDKYPKNCQCDKEYFWTVWNTKYPAQVKQVLQHANAQRYTISNEAAEQNSIVISDEWKDQLDALPYNSKKKGRMTAFLK